MTKTHHPAASARILTGAGTTIAFIAIVTGFQVSAAVAHNQAVLQESTLSILNPVPAPTPAESVAAVTAATATAPTTKAPTAAAPVAAAPAKAAPAKAAPKAAAPAPAPAAPAPAPAAAPAAPAATTAGSGG